MLTLDQWKNVRRVDHITLPGFSFRRGFYWAHPRVRGPENRPDLKIYDPWVAAFNMARNDVDKMTQLGLIIQAAALIISQRDVQGFNDRYYAVVNTLHNHALTEVNRICGVGKQQAVENYITGQNRPAKQITVNIIILTQHGHLLPHGILNKITTHITAANAVFQAANISLQRASLINTHLTQYQGRSITLTQPDFPQQVVGKVLPASTKSGGRLIGYCNSLGNNNGATCIDIVYIPDFELSDVAGMTLRAGNQYCEGGIPLRPIVLINTNPSQALIDRGGINTTLAHELGHAVSGYGSHSANADNLMAGGDARNGNNNLTLGQQAWYSSSGWVS